MTNPPRPVTPDRDPPNAAASGPHSGPGHPDRPDRPDRIAENLAQVRARIDAAARQAGRDPAAVTLVAVTKGHDARAAGAAAGAGQRVFGENRVQEAAAKWPELRDRFPGTQLHMIGPLQTNKIAEALALFDVIETVDRPRLAARIRLELDRNPTLAARPPRFFVQVNTGEEPQKAGVAPTAADAFIDELRDRHGLVVSGLMCIPPRDEEPSPHFALLARIAARNGVPELSMGMSGDYEVAVAFGATLVRVGTAIFGERPPPA